MNKDDFLNKLEYKISFLDKKTSDKYINIYADKINRSLDRGLTEKEAINRVGSLKSIIKQIKIDEGILVKHDQQQISTLKIILMVVVLFVFLFILYITTILVNITSYKNMSSILFLSGTVLVLLGVNICLIVKIIFDKLKAQSLKKITIFSSSFVCLTGIVFLSTSLLISKNNFENILNFGNYEIKEYVLEDDKGINFLNCENINFITKDSVDNIVVKTYNNKDIYFEYSNDGFNTIKQNGIIINDKYIKKYEIEVIVPTGKLISEDIKIESEVSNVSLNSLEISNLTVRTSEINLSVNNTSINYVSIRSDYTVIILSEGVIIETCYISSNESLNIEANKGDIGKLNVESKEISLEIESTKIINLLSTSTNLDAYLSNFECEYISVLSKDINLECKNSKIQNQYYGVDKGLIMMNLLANSNDYKFVISTTGQTNVSTGGNGQFLFELESKNVDLTLNFV